MTIGALSSIDVGEYWKVETVGQQRVLNRVDKPTFVCKISRDLAFVEVMEVAIEALKAEGLDADEEKSARENLLRRCTHLFDRQSFIEKTVLAIFLWIYGFTGEHSPQSMADGLITVFAPPEEETSNENLKAFVEKHPNLKSIQLPYKINITDEGIKAVAENCSSLEQIDLSESCRITDKSLKALAENCPGLKSINLKGCDEITDEGFKALAEKCPRLTNIDLTRCDKITGDGLKALVKGCPLTDINLESCLVTDEMLQDIVENCSNLEILGLEVNREITDVGLQAVAGKCSQLQCIKLLFSEEITDKSLKALADGCPQLKSISFPYSKKITEEGFKDFVTKCLLLEEADVRFCGLSDKCVDGILNSRANLLIRN